MKFRVEQIGQPVMGSVRQIQAVSDNGIAVSFPEPKGVELAISHVLDIDLERIAADQDVTDLTTGLSMTLKIPERDVHDMRLPSRHGVSRFPAEARRRGE